MRRIPDNFFFAASPLFSAGLAFLAVPLLTWTMPAETIANFGLFQYTSSVLLIFVTLGLDQAFLRALNSSREHSVLLRKCLAPVVVLLALIGVTVGFIREASFATDLYGSHADWIITTLWINVAFLALHRFAAQQTRMNMRGGFPYLMSELLLRIPILVVLGILAVQQKTGSFIWIISATLVGAALSALVLIIHNRTTWIGLWHARPNEGEQSTTQLLQFGAPLAVAGLMYWGIGNIGVYLTQWMHGPSEAARLVVATSVANMAAIGQAMFSLLWLPKVYRKIDTDLTPQDIELAAHRTCVGAALVYAAVVIALHGAQYLLGERYRDIAPQAAALCVLPVMFCISEVTMIGLMVKRRATMALSATAVGLATSALANIVLTIPLSGTGACMALTLAAFAFLSARTEFAARVWQPIRRRNLYFGATLIAVAGFVAPIIPSTFGPINLILLLPYFLLEKKTVRQLLVDFREFAAAR